MRVRPSCRSFAPLASVVASVAALVVAAPAASATGDPRDEDPILVQGADLPGARGARVDALRVGTFRAGAPVLVPAQVDERNATGRYVCTDGPDAAQDEDGGALDANDELVLLWPDAGEAGDPWAAWPGATAVDAVEVVDPLRPGTTRHVYLLRFPSAAEAPPAPVPSPPYVAYEPAADAIRARRYLVAFPDVPKISYERFEVPPSAGGTGVDLFDRFKMRMRFSALFGALSVDLDETDMASRLACWRVGPVRALRRITHSVELGLGLGTPEVVAESLYYPTYFEFPSEVDIPFKLDFVLTEAEVLTVTDFSRAAIGMTMYTDTNPKGVTIDGKTSEAEQALDLGPYTWSVVSGPQGAWMNRVRYLNDVPFTKNLFYEDDATADRAPENEPGAIGTNGYNLGALEKAAKGKYLFVSHVYVPVGYRPGDERKYLDMADRPLETSVRAVARTAAPPAVADASGEAPKAVATP